MMKNNFINIIVVFTLVFIISACGDSKYETKEPTDVETMNSGKLRVVVDESIKSILDTGLVMYQNDYKKVLLTSEYKNARKSMAELLGGLSRVTIIARDYLHDEDSLMKLHKVEKHHRMKVATDALVIFADKDFPIDTLNDSELKRIFQDGERLSKMFKLNGEAKYYINEVNSSEYASFNKYILEEKQLKTALNFLNGFEEVKNKVLEDKNSIGIAFLSQVNKDERFKMIEIGFHDAKGKYIRPVPVHQGYIVQERYPYLVDIWVYLLEDRRNLPFWFGSYIAKESKYQKIILEKGIVPEFARFQLVNE